MKTIHQNSENKVEAGPSGIKLLVDAPQGHYLLAQQSIVPFSPLSLASFQDLILTKKSKSETSAARSTLFFFVGLCLSMLLTIMAFEWRFYADYSLVDLGEVKSNMEELVEIPLTQQPPPPPPKVVQPEIVEVANEEEITEDIKVDFDISMNEETVVEVVVAPAIASEPEEEVADEIFTFVEQKPEPVGGIQAFYDFVAQNMKYPSQAARMGIEGKVFVQFVVEKDGSLTDIQVVKGIGAGCDEEAIRVLKMAPKWSPGKQRGVPVRVRNIFPIVFRLYR
jgi:protein TonB